MSNIGEPIGNTVVKVGLDDTTLKQGLTNLNAQMKLADNTWKASLSTFKQSDRSIEKLSTSVVGMNNKLAAQSKIVNAHQQRVAKLTQEYGENHTKVIRANAELAKQQSVYGNLKRSINEVTAEIRELNKAEAIKNSPFTQRQKELEAYSSKLKSVGDKWTSAGQSMSMAVTAPLAGIGAVGLKTAMDFDAQMSRVGAISDTTGAKFNEMKQVAMELGASTTKSASEVAKGMEEMAAKGYDANQIMAAMPGIISAAEASGSDMTQTANVMASAMNAFGIEASKSSHVADVLAQTANQSAADITDMEYALKYAAAPAKSLGMSLEETSASIGMMVDAGLKGEQAGTTLRGALLGLLSPSEANSKLMKKMGVEITDASGNFVGMEQLVRNLEKSMAGMTDTQKAANLSQLVGKEAVSGMLVMMEQGPDKIGKMTKSLEASDGASQKASKSMMNNLKGAVEEMGGAFETVGIQIGQDMTPAVRELAEDAQTLATKFSEMPGWARKTAVGIGLVAAATGPVIVGVGLVAKATGTAADGLAKLTGKYAANTIAAEGNALANATAGTALGKSSASAGKAGGLLSMFGKNASNAGKSVGLLARGAGLLQGGLSLLTGPVGLTVTAIMAAGAAFKFAYNHVDWFHKGIDNTAKLAQQVSASMDWSWVGRVGKAFKDTGDDVSWFIGKVGSITGKAVEMTPAVQIMKKSFELVGAATSKATNQADIYGKGVSKSTKEALRGYTDLSQKATLKLQEIKISHTSIGQKTYDSIVKIYSDINTEVTRKIDDRRQREIAGLKKIFTETRGLSDLQEESILNKTKAQGTKEKQEVQKIQQQITAIYRKAKNDKRALTQTEEAKIANLQARMDKKVVTSLSQSEKEQRIILGRLKSNKSKLSLEAAAKVIQHSAKERDESISNAKKKRDKVIDEAIYQRDVAKNISKKQADAIIADADRQYKKSKSSAEKQHKSVVSEAQKQNKGVKSNIDAQTGHVYSKWQKINKDVKTYSDGAQKFATAAFKNAYKNTGKWLSETSKNSSKKWSDIKKSTGNWTESVRKNAVKKYEDLKTGASKWLATTASNSFKKWSDIKKSTGSSTESIRKNAVKKYEDLKTGASKWLSTTASNSSKKWSDIKKSTGSLTENIRKTAVDKYESLKKGTTGWLSSAAKAFTSKWSDIKKSTSGWTESVRKTAVDKFEDMYDGSKKWIGEIGKFISNSASGLKTKASDMGKSVANGAISGLNGMIGGINSITMKIMDKNLLSKIPLLSTGTGAGAGALVRNGAITRPTLAVVGDKGPGNGPGGYRREIIEKANGDKYLTPARDTLVQLDKGDKVRNGTDTHAYMQQFPHFSRGTLLDKMGDGWNATKSFAGDVWNAGKKKIVDLSNYAAKFMGDIFEYADKPEKLVDLVVGKLGGAFGQVGGFTGDLAGAAFSKIKSGLIDKVKEWFEEFGGGDADGSSFTSFRINTPYSPNARPPDYPYPAAHFGIDYGTPQGHPITAPTAGKLSTSFDPKGGLVAILRMANGWQQFFMHMESVVNKEVLKKGDYLGKTGGQVGLRNSGMWSNGPHLHYQVNQGSSIWNSGTVDPGKFLSSVGYGKGGPAAKGSGYEYAKSIIKSAQAILGGKYTDSSITENMLKLAKRESNYQPNVVNNWDSNAQKGDPSRGLFQIIGSTFRANAAPGHTNFNSPLDQAISAMRYIVTRYGWSGFPRAAAYAYANGGIIDHPHFGLVGEAGPEAIIPLDPKKKRQALPLLEQANSIVHGDNLIKLSTGTTKSKSSASKSYSTHNIVWGDTLWDLARTFKTTVAELKRLNGLNSDLIIAGRKLKVPGKTTATVNVKVQQSRQKPSAYVRTNRIGVLDSIADNLMARSKTTKFSSLSKSYGAIGSLINSKLKTMKTDAPETVLKNVKSIVSKVDSTLKADEKKLKTNADNLKKYATNSKKVAQIRAESAAIKNQMQYLQSVKKNELLKGDVLAKVVKQRAMLSASMKDLQSNNNVLKGEKASLAGTVRDNIKGYAGFGSVSGHSTSDFLSVMRYRLRRMQEFHNDLIKLRKMGLDPGILRELIEGGVENSYGKAKVLLRGGSTGVKAINAMQTKINKIAVSMGLTESGLLYNEKINKQSAQLRSLTQKRTALRTHNDRYMNSKVVKMRAPNPAPRIKSLSSAQRREAASRAATHQIVTTAKRLNVVGKNDKYAHELEKTINRIKNDKVKSNDKIIADLQKEMSKQSKNMDKVVELMALILHKNIDVILDGDKVTKKVDKRQAVNTKTNARRRTS